MRKLVVEESAGGTRVDALVASVLGVSTAEARRLAAAKLVRIDGHLVKKGDRLRPGQVVEIDEEHRPSLVVEPDRDLHVDVLFEDEHLVAIDKPASIPSHPLAAGERGTAANAIVARWPECREASPDPREGGVGHRLDKATSGVLIAARNRKAWEGLREALSAPSTEKIYLAEVIGHPPSTGEVSTSIGHGGRRGERVRVGSGRGTLPAHTEWRTIASRPDTTLLEVRIHAGRRHQVRAHLASAGYPILGDVLYGTETARMLAAQAGGLHLHASSVSFRHPITGAALTIVAPPPGWATASPA